MSTKTLQGKLWSGKPAYWTQHFEPWFLPMYKTVLEQLKPTSDHLLLDAGCGSGLFTYMANKTGTQVIGIDAAPGLLEEARRRNPDINFLEEDLEALPFADESFDFVTGFNSFQYAGSFHKSIAEAVRVLKPGGKLVIGIWDKPEKSDATHILKAVSSLLPPPPPGTPGPFALSEDGIIEKALEEVGLKLNFKTSVPCTFLYKNLSEGIKSFLSTGPAAAALNINSEDVVKESLAKALEPFHLADDMYFMQNHFLVFIATK
jgi:SAM-dependent methyltransferase